MPEEYDALIDAYLKGKLSESEIAEVERLLAADTSFREELQFREQVAKAFARNEHDQLKSRLQGFATEEGTAIVPIAESGKQRKWWYAAASILLIGMIGLFYWSQQSARPASELYVAYFEPYPNVVAPIVRESTESDLRMDAYAHYEQGDYDMAYELFGRLMADGNADAEMLFYQALSAMQLNRDEEAISLLATYVDSPNQKLIRQAQWYLALATIKIGETKSAIKLLEQLSASSGYKQTEANALKKELKP